MTDKQHSTKDDDPTLAEVVGGGFAILQHGIDKVASWGFSKMKDMQRNTDPDADIANPHLKKAAKVGRGIMGFIADTGQAYYRSYEEMKRRGGKGDRE